MVLDITEHVHIHELIIKHVISDMSLGISLRLYQIELWISIAYLNEIELIW